MQIDWKHRHNHVPPSAVHGWLTKLRGLITFDRHLLHRGNREIQDADEHRKYIKERDRRHKIRRIEQEQATHGSNEGGLFSRLLGRSTYSDGGSRRRRHRGHRPFMHMPKRCRPWYHGQHHIILGFLTRQPHRIALGRSMKAEADRERRRERRRRQRRLQLEGFAIRTGSDTLHPSRRHHHSRHGHHRYAPEVVITG